MGTRLMGRLLALLVLAAVAVGVAFGAFAAVVTVKTAKSSVIGSIVVSGAGLTLYHNTGEVKGSVSCTGACAQTWLPLTVSGGAKPTGGAGITASKLGTVRRPDGRAQVTYGGLALYRYAKDARPGDVNGQGKDQLWYAITPAGTITKAGATSPAAKSSGATARSPTPAAAPPAQQLPAPGAGAAGECPGGQTIPQAGMFGPAGDADDDNKGDPSDGDGCL